MDRRMTTGGELTRSQAESKTPSGNWQQIGEFFNVSSTCRFSIFGLLLLVTIVPVSRFALPLLMENALLLDNFSQAILASFSWYVTAALLLLQIRAAWVHGAERFAHWNELTGKVSHREARDLAAMMEDSHRRGMGWPAWLYMAWVLLPMPGLTLVADLNLRVNREFITVETLYGGFLLGGLLATLSLVMLSFLRKYFLPGVIPLRGIFPFESLHHQHDHLLDRPEEVAKLPRGVAVMLARIGLVRGPGYSMKDTDGIERPLAGHLELALLLGLLLSTTFVLGIAEHILFPGSNLTKVIPTIGHFALVVAILTTIASGMAFWLDRFRVSTLLTASILGLALFFVRDYDFKVERSEIASTSLVEAIEARDIPRSGSRDPRQSNQRTLIVVTAPGGGIHAAAWSAEVLTRLDERWPGTFRNSLGMISAVSGGSVGSMYYVDAISDANDPVPLEEVRKRAQQSNLEPIFFAATFHDVLPLTPFDRGTAAEHFWDFTMRSSGRPSPKLGAWGDLSKQGQLPVVVFNATDVKSGRRVILGSAALHEHQHNSEEAGHDIDPHCSAFDLRSNDLDMKVATAVRLSASFPYVTPISKPAADENGEAVMPAVRMGDGAYADNDGIMTALESVSQLIDKFCKKTPEERPFDRILLININNYGDSSPHASFDESGGQFEALSYATIGPLLGLSNVRGASQAERGQLEVGFLEDRTVTEQEVMWVLHHLSRRPDRSSPEDGPSDAQYAGDSQFSLQAQRKARNRLERFGISSSEVSSDKATPSRGIPARQVSQGRPSFGQNRTAGPGLYPIQFKVVSIPYFGSSDPPLSWKLSSEQMKTYERAWNQLDQEAEEWVTSSQQDIEEQHGVPPLRVIEDWLGPPAGKQRQWSMANRSRRSDSTRSE
ncbi:patatin-like phospholipase family protein [Bremerella sp. JC817]|uniref:patatin-like phospholipase family protein n=1 Tax=Bremerella sp. JC817 TaxID=3231756 RepID=UPI00345A49DD